VLLTGARGTGKSSLVKAALDEFSRKGLRLIEVDKRDLVDLPDIVDLIADRPSASSSSATTSPSRPPTPATSRSRSRSTARSRARPTTCSIYATSNRRHLMPEFMDENLEAKHVGGEIHPGETTEEKISLSERFGIWLSFYPFDQEQYLDIADHWVEPLGGKPDEASRKAALLVALERGFAQRPRRVAVRARPRRAPGGRGSDEDHRGRRGGHRAPGEFLLAQRPEGKPYRGYWEFPGGKIEPGEDPRAALGPRAARRSSASRCATPRPGSRAMYAYTHATVRLHFFRVTAWDGEPRRSRTRRSRGSGSATRRRADAARERPGASPRSRCRP
jgi:hypothetical protein